MRLAAEAGRLVGLALLLRTIRGRRRLWRRTAAVVSSEGVAEVQAVRLDVAQVQLVSQTRRPGLVCQSGNGFSAAEVYA